MATGYIQGLEQRTSADIAVYYFEGQVRKTLYVPITPRSMYRYTLMQDDYIQLEFSLDEAVNIGIGSYINDTYFGWFYVISEQMPKYNPATCGYDYSLRFDKDYLRWKNHLHCLVSNSKRMEVSWSLTDRLAVHAQQIADNVNIIFEPVVEDVTDTTTGTTYHVSSAYLVDVSASLVSANEIKYLSYDGIDIISALNEIAEAYQCEWWVGKKDVTIGTYKYSNTIFFGKCELDNTAFQLTLGDNVESMETSRDQQTFANRIFAYGGTRNIPENYDRQLIFKADTTTISGSRVTTVMDSTRPVTLEMIKGDATVTPVDFTFGSATTGGSGLTRTYTLKTDIKSLSGDQTIYADLASSLTMMSYDWAGTAIPQVSVTAFLYYGTNLQRMHVELDENQLITDGKTWYAEVSLDRTFSLGSTAVNVYAEIVWTVTFAYQSEHLNDEVDCGVNGTMTTTADASTATKQVVVRYNNINYPGTFSGADGKITFGTSKPPRAFTNQNYTLFSYVDNTILPLNELKVPLSYYTFDYNAGTMRMVGEKRMHLPSSDYPNRYIDTENTQSAAGNIHSLFMDNASQIVEAVVVFEDVYPKLTLRIKENSLTETLKKQKVEYSDGSVSWEEWTQYSFKAEYQNNGTWQDFPFKLEYMLDGAKLQVVFTAPQSTPESGFLLSGMTFNADFTQGYGGSVYTIIRNEDYGAMLPNNVLKPTEGDTFILTGWNPRALDELGIVDAAEQELATKAEEYLDAIQEGQFTFNVRMMSDVFYDWNYGGRGDDSNGLKTFGLLALGAKVTINDDSLPGGSKSSRIIGYEYKLDIPHDTPTYIIGETEAFSRLKQIEKQLTKL